MTYGVLLPDGRVRLAHVNHLLADGWARALDGTEAAEDLPMRW